MVSVTLYGKPGCHLCEQAREVLLGVQSEIAFTLTDVNILDNEELFAEYAESIPVVDIGDSFFCRYRIDPHELKMRIQKEQS